MKVLVCGGRNFADSDLVLETLDKIQAETPIDTVIHGGARGADSEAEYWAGLRQVDSHIYRPKWSAEGLRAGPLRNARMLDDGKPDLVVAFPGGRGTSDGTADMVRRARAAGIEVIEVRA